MRFKAELKRDEKGRIIGIREFDIIHYCIILSMEGLPDNVQKVIYELHETYDCPKIEVKSGKSNYAAEITSYGDYEIKVNIFTDEKDEIIKVMLSEALAERYYQDNSIEIKQ